MGLSAPTSSEEENALLQAIGISVSGFDELLYKAQDPWLVAARQYMKACTALCEHVLSGKTMLGNLIMPILFCFRHSVELFMKCILETIRADQENTLKLYTGHSVDHLKNMLASNMPADMKAYVVIFEDLDNKTATASIADDIALILRWVTTLNKVDPISDRFRYPVSKLKDEYEYPSLQDSIGVKDVQTLIDTLKQLDAAYQRVRFFFEQYPNESIAGTET